MKIITPKKVVLRVYMVRCNGVVIDDEHNAHSSLIEAQKYYEQAVFKYLYDAYDIILIEKSHTILSAKE